MDDIRDIEREGRQFLGKLVGRRVTKAEVIVLSEYYRERTYHEAMKRFVGLSEGAISRYAPRLEREIHQDFKDSE